MGILDWFNRPPSPEQFAKRYAAFLTKKGYAGPFRFVADEFQFRIGPGDRIFNLHNVYRDYCGAARRERDKVLARYAHSLDVPELPGSFAAARTRLLPVLRAKSYLGTLARMARADGNDMGEQASRPFSRDTVVMLVHDTEHAMQSVPAKTLDEWGVSFDDACQAALDNLRDISVAKFDRIAPDLVVSDWNDSYDSSRVLLPDVLHQAGLGAAPVFMIPTRGRLLAASSANAAAMAQMVDVAHAVVQDEGRLVSARMYRLEGRTAVEFVPDDPAVAANLKRLDMTFLGDDYAQQKAELDRIHERAGIDLFVATYAVYEMNGEPVSVSTLGEGVDTLLPKTDAIAFVAQSEDDGKQRIRVVKWEDAWPVLGASMVRQDDDPERYRISVFPPEHVLQALPALSPATAAA